MERSTLHLTLMAKRSASRSSEVIHIARPVTFAYVPRNARNASEVSGMETEQWKRLVESGALNASSALCVPLILQRGSIANFIINRSVTSRSKSPHSFRGTRSHIASIVSASYYVMRSESGHAIPFTLTSIKSCTFEQQPASMLSRGVSYQYLYH